jgi:broad specificity phosphatase PhoE
VTRILLVRHAQAHGHEESDPTLDGVGEKQASALARRLASEDVGRLLTGPKRRAVQTAAAIAGLVGREHESTPLLDDRTPVPSPDRRDDYPADRWARLDETPLDERDENAEGLSAAWSELTAAASADPGTGSLVLVTHAFVVAGFVSRVLGAPPAAWMQLPVSNASVTEVELRPGRAAAVVGFNDVGHLR